ncbi:MbtH family protein [Streptomyces sp. NPDC018045]|uniref:MbtH family protein n=1 Tax=Streptomyces sp. NPDC018045 TaxID=3365037 RepID=UPI0037B7AB84
MTDPFAAADGACLVLVNDEGQHSLWPSTIDVPQGWTTVHGPAPYRSCLDHVTAHWPDLRPRGLVHRHHHKGGTS